MDLKIKDLTGAGDLFAGGFLHSLINNKSIEESLKTGTEMSSKIIQIIGARLNNYTNLFLSSFETTFSFFRFYNSFPVLSRKKIFCYFISFFHK